MEDPAVTPTKLELWKVVDGWKKNELSDRDPTHIDYICEVLEEGAYEVISIITFVDGPTGSIDDAHASSSVQYINVPNPYDPMNNVGVSKFFYSVVDVDYCFLGLAPIHGPCAELFRPWDNWMTKSSPYVSEDTIEEQIWYPVADLLTFSDMLEYIKDWMPVMTQDSDPMNLEKMMYMPVFLKNMVECELFLPLVHGASSKLYPNLCVPEVNDNIDLEEEERRHPLITRDCSYYGSPCYIPLSFPYSRVIDEMDNEDKEYFVSPKQTPFLFMGEIENRIDILGKLIFFTQRKTNTKQYYKRLSTRKHHDNSSDQSFYPVFDAFFSMESYERKEQLSSKNPLWIDNARHIKRQIITGTYEYATKNGRQHGSDSMAHDYFVDGLSYFYMFYLYAEHCSPSDFLVSFLSYRMSLQTSVWISGNDKMKRRTVPDVSSLARFRMHVLLLNGCVDDYFDSYRVAFSSQQKRYHVEFSPMLSRATLEHVFINAYEDVINNRLKSLSITKNAGSELEFISACGLGGLLNAEMSTDPNSPPPISIALNFDVFIQVHIRSFVHTGLASLSRQFKKLEHAYYEERFFPGEREREQIGLNIDPDPELKLLMGKMFEMSNDLAKRLEVTFYYGEQ